jgi:hypothetical protein
VLPPANGLTNPNSFLTDPVADLTNTPAEQEFVAQLVAPGMGVRPEQVPGWSTLLLGPVFRGAEVSFR